MRVLGCHDSAAARAVHFEMQVRDRRGEDARAAHRADLLAARDLPADGKSEMGFSNNGEVLQASSLHLDYYRDIARRVAVKIADKAKDMTAKFPSIVVQNT